MANATFGKTLRLADVLVWYYTEQKHKGRLSNKPLKLIHGQAKDKQTNKQKVRAGMFFCDEHFSKYTSPSHRYDRRNTTVNSITMYSIFHIWKFSILQRFG